jgi:hypothetical protein
LKVYAKPGSAELLSDSFDAIAEELKFNADILGGSIKAATTGLYSPKIHTDDSSNVIVLAIRGTVTKHDWMVNLNDGAENSVQDAFLVSSTAAKWMGRLDNENRVLMRLVVSTVLMLDF